MTKIQKAVAIFSIMVLCVVVGIVLTVIINQRANATTDKMGKMMDSEIPLHENTYYDVVSGLIDKYGIAIGEDGLNSDKGVFYAGLFDFNNDDNNEFITFFYDDRIFDYEIWTNDGEGIEKLNSSIYECYALRTRYEISVTTIEGRSYFIEVQDAYALAGIDGGRFSTIYTIEDEQWVEKERLEYTYLYKEGMEDDLVFMEANKDKENGECYMIIKGNESKELSKEKYDQVLDSYYNNSCINVISSEWGYPVKYGIMIDMSDNNKQLVEFVEILEVVQNK